MFTLNCRGRLLVIDSPIVMGIINATPDSFYSGSRQESVEGALQKAEEMLKQGATILDIGGQSTRPGSEMGGVEEEIKRVMPVIDAIAGTFPEAYISIDTFHSQVAKAAVDSGASIINDISSGQFDPEMLATAASLKAPYIGMHLKGTPETMHIKQDYDDVIADVLAFFIRKAEECRKLGITDFIPDPGFGFSKKTEDNFRLIKYLEAFSVLQKPLLLGVSRKSTIYKTLGTTPEESLNGTTVLNTAGLLKGAAILRVHDIKEAMEAIRLTNYLK